MERISDKSPCLNCCSDQQIGNPDVWQSDCYRCEKLPNWKAKVINRLFDIEDILGDDYDLDRLKELAQADREGRCVVMPCKVGETVYTIEQEFNGFCTEVKIEKRIIDGCGGNLLNPVWVVSKKPYELHYFPSEFGKTVFTTREEAESALEKMKEGK